MNKIMSTLGMLLFLGAAMAGCTEGPIEQIDKVIEPVNEPISENGIKFVYIPSSYPIQEEHPLKVHFTAYPLNVNSPYELTQICSIDDGHAVDVYEAWVIFPGAWQSYFTEDSEIESWHVYDANDSPLDEFSLDPMTNILSFQNPMVVFGDDDEGHKMSEMFENDLNEWICENEKELEPENIIYTPEQVLALIGVDGTAEAVLNLDAVAIGQEKFGMNMVMIVPIETLELGEMAEDMSGDVEVTSSSMYDNVAERATNSMFLSMEIQGMTMSAQMSDTQGAHPEIPNAGIINRVMTNMETFQPEAEWLIDYDWNYSESMEDIGMMIEPPQECDGHGSEMDNMGNMGPHCMCDEGYDWDDGDMMTCILTNGNGDNIEGENSSSNEGDEPGPPEPSALELAATEWTTLVDENTGIQSFSGTVIIEGMGNWSVILKIMPTVPPKVTGLLMANDTESYDMSFIYGDEVNINLVSETIDSWERAATDFMLKNNGPDVFHEEICTNTENENATMELIYGDYQECISFNWNEVASWSDQGSDGIDNDGDEEIDEDDEDWVYYYECSNEYSDQAYPLSENECNAFEATIVHDTMLDYTLIGQIEVLDSNLEIHIFTTGYDEDGVEIEQIVNFTVENQPWDTEDVPVIGTWTNDDGATWTIYWRCDDSEDQPSVVQEECMIQMSTNDFVVMGNGGFLSGPSTNFDVKLYDTWAEDYTGMNSMPSFTLGLTITALLGACLLLQRKKLE